MSWKLEKKVSSFCMKPHCRSQQCVVCCGNHLEDIRAAREVSARVVTKCGMQMLPPLPNNNIEAQAEAPDKDEQDRRCSSSFSPSTSLLSSFGNFGRKPYDLENAEAKLPDGSCGEICRQKAQQNSLTRTGLEASNEVLLCVSHTK